MPTCILKRVRPLQPGYESDWSEEEKERWRKQGELVSTMSAMFQRKWRADEKGRRQI